jgi:hypothetical protein
LHHFYGFELTLPAVGRAIATSSIPAHLPDGWVDTLRKRLDPFKVLYHFLINSTHLIHPGHDAQSKFFVLHLDY